MQQKSPRLVSDSESLNDTSLEAFLVFYLFS